MSFFLYCPSSSTSDDSSFGTYQCETDLCFGFRFPERPRGMLLMPPDPPLRHHSTLHSTLQWATLVTKQQVSRFRLVVVLRDARSGIRSWCDRTWLRLVQCYDLSAVMVALCNVATMLRVRLRNVVLWCTAEMCQGDSVTAGCLRITKSEGSAQTSQYSDRLHMHVCLSSGHD